MGKLEKDILLKALENHITQRRNPVHFRVVIKSYLNQLPVESSSEEKFINGIREGTWLTYNDMTAASAAAMAARSELEGYLRSHHIDAIEYGRSSTTTPEIYLALGYAFCMSKKFHVRHEGEAFEKDLQSRGLNCSIMAELQKGADLFASEALDLTEYRDLVRTKHLIPTGFIGYRVSGSVEDALSGQEADVIEGAEKTVTDTFQALEEAGFAIRVKGTNLCFTWSGIVLTRAGAEAAQKLKEQIHLDFLESQQLEAGKTMFIKCSQCAETLLQTTRHFRSDKSITGAMLEAIPNTAESAWSFSFGANDTGESIQCPNCGSPLVDHDLFRFKPGVLVDPPEEVEEPDPVETINDFVLWKCAQGPGQKIPAGKLYEAYLTFCNTKEVEAVTQKSFGMALSNFGFKPDQDNKTRFWTGLGLLNP